MKPCYKVCLMTTWDNGWDKLLNTLHMSRDYQSDKCMRVKYNNKRRGCMSFYLQQFKNTL